jgi:hypothetical protein
MFISRFYKLCAVLGTVALVPSFVRAQSTELLVNGGFDNVQYATNNFSQVRGNAPLAGITNVNTALGLINSPTTLIPGWGTSVFSTTASAYVIEVWNGTFNSPSEGPRAYGGTQYAEMNSHAAGTLTQTIGNLAPGSPLYLSFAHSDRGADATSSSMRVTLFDLGANGTFDSVVATPGSSNAVLGGDDSFLIDQFIGPTTYNAGATPIGSNWNFHEFQTSSVTNNNMMLAFQSVTSGTTGNFLDSVSLNTSPAASVSAPEPSTLALISMLSFSIGLVRRRKK